MALPRSGELAQLAGSVLQPGFSGTTAPDWVRRRIAEGLRAVVLFGRNIVDIDQVAELTAALRAENPELIVAIDEEAGDVTRLGARTGASWPGNYALGAVDDVDLTEHVAYGIGRELRSAGISLNYAPSVDVNSNPRNPVIGVRSFGDRTDLVSRHGAAWVRGLQAAGVAACAKHFPGHGDTAVDSHHGLPQVEADAGELARVDLPPFSAAMDAGVRAVMTAHVLLPAYDTELPATLSPRILDGLLRRELGFDGLIVTDGIEMGAVSDVYGIDGATVRAVAAGVDAVCVGGEHSDEATADLLLAALVKAVREGTLSEERLAEAAGRVRDFIAWSGRLGASAGGHDGAAEVGLTAARRALQIIPEQATLPLGRAPHIVELESRTSLAVDSATPWGVALPMRDLLPGTTSVRLSEADLAADPGMLPRTLAEAVDRPLVVVVRDAARHAWMDAAVTELIHGRPDAVVVEMGVAQGPALGSLYLVTHGASRVCGLAAAERLAGVTATA